MLQVFNSKMDHFLGINGVKLIQDSLIVEFLVLLYLMHLIRSTKIKQPNMFSNVKILTDLLEVFLMLSHMLLMCFVVLELWKSSKKLTYLINNFFANGSAKDKHKKVVSMEGHKNCLMFVIHGGFILLSACWISLTGLIKRHCKTLF